MNDTQKILKELSDLTKNLDILVKEMREYTKSSDKVQKTVAKSSEESAKRDETATKKAEDSSKRMEEEFIKLMKEKGSVDKALESLQNQNLQNQDQKKEENKKEDSKKEESKKEDPAKEVLKEIQKSSEEAQEKREGMFSKFLGVMKEDSEKGNEVFKQASLKSLKDAGDVLAKGGSVKEAAAGGLKGGIDQALFGLGGLAAEKGKKALTNLFSKKVSKTDELKEKEKVVTPEEKGKEEKKEKEKKAADLKSLEGTQKKKEEKKEGEKKEKKGIFSKLGEKLGIGKEEGKEEASKTVQEKTTIQDKIKEIIKEKEKEKSEKTKEVKEISSLTTIVSPPKEEEKKEKESLGSKLKKGAKDIINSKLIELGIKKPGEETGGTTEASSSPGLEGKTGAPQGTTETPSLGEKTGPDSAAGASAQSQVASLVSSVAPSLAPKSTSPSTPEAKAPDQSSAPEKGSSTPSSPSPEKKETSAPASGGGTTSPASSGITAKDIEEIKALLSSINISLGSPLNINDTKPFRPNSNMLEL